MSFLAEMFGSPVDSGSIFDMPSSSDSLSALQGQMTFARMASTVMAGGMRAASGFSSAADQDLNMQLEAN